VKAKLADYVLDERPDSSDEHVFLRSLAHYTRLADHASIYRVIADTFDKAGVLDVRAGTRFLRHNAASRLIRAGVPLPTISAVLGHASSESTNVYMSVDEVRLLESDSGWSRQPNNINMLLGRS
jgi:site-specific recombinase XerD